MKLCKFKSMACTMVLKDEIIVTNMKKSEKFSGKNCEIRIREWPTMRKSSCLIQIDEDILN